MKKLFAVFLAVILLISASTVCAAGTPRYFDLFLTETAAPPGDTVVINVDVRNNPGIAAFTVAVVFDPDILEYDGYVDGLCKKDVLGIFADHINIVYNSRYIGSDGTLFGLRFRVKDDAPLGTSAVSLRNIQSGMGSDLSGCFADNFGNMLIPTAQGGSVTVAEYIYGDLNFDGSVSIADLVRLKRIAAGSLISQPSADLNADGGISAEDLVLERTLLLGRRVAPAGISDEDCTKSGFGSTVRVAPAGITDITSAKS